MSDHPLLPGAWNSEEFNGWEFNCPGFNVVPVQPAASDYYEPLRPLIITDDMLAIFDGCSDLTVPKARDTIVVPSEIEELIIS